MANIIVSHFGGIRVKEKNYFGSFYEGLLAALARAGNNVLHLVMDDFNIDPWCGENTLYSYYNENEIEEIIKSFNPDLIIAFNNSTFKKIHKIVDCPIALWDADSVCFFSDQDTIKRNVDRYHFLSFSKSALSHPSKLFGAHKSRIYWLAAATDFRAEDIEVNRNISFIGTLFSVPDNLRNYYLKYISNEDKLQELKRAIKAAKNDPWKSKNEFYIDLDNDELREMEPRDLGFADSGQKRIKILDAISDLGLEVYGTKNWQDIFNYSIELALCYKSNLLYSLQHNQDLYNSSKLCISISHGQNVTGFPWRVMDIMATNGCLVSDYKADLDLCFAQYVKIPTYTCSHEARDICKNLLQDEARRKEIVQASQLAIEKVGRFEHRLKELETIFNINLFPGGEGKITRLETLEEIDNIKMLKQKFIDTGAYYSLKYLPNGWLPFIKNIARSLGIRPNNKYRIKYEKKLKK